MRICNSHRRQTILQFACKLARPTPDVKIRVSHFKRQRLALAEDSLQNHVQRVHISEVIWVSEVWMGGGGRSGWSIYFSGWSIYFSTTYTVWNCNSERTWSVTAAFPLCDRLWGCFLMLTWVFCWTRSCRYRHARNVSPSPYGCTGFTHGYHTQVLYHWVLVAIGTGTNQAARPNFICTNSQHGGQYCRVFTCRKNGHGTQCEKFTIDRP